MYLSIVCVPSFSPTSPKTVLTQCVRASVNEIAPNCSLPKLLSGTPEITFGDLPLMNEFGVYLPESIAAEAVTTLKVDPGGYFPCVARLSVDAAAPMPPLDVTRFGLNPGSLAITRTRPVEGSIATTDPRRPASACSATR